jgi:uncharacterized protein YndB with AHSA1/START domain
MGTVNLHRVLRAAPDKIYRAFLDASALERWIPPHGFLGKVHEIDARVGGGYRMSFTNFGSGKTHSFRCRYVELIPGELLRYEDEFDDPNLPGTMQISIRLRAVACGSEIEIRQENIPALIPVEFCYLGWQESLLQLANLVEPNIPD